ncbi:MAG: hypothetical protein EHM56_11710, partial [Chloroflexi bacterium]
RWVLPPQGRGERRPLPRPLPCEGRGLAPPSLLGKGAGGLGFPRPAQEADRGGLLPLPFQGRGLGG